MTKATISFLERLARDCVSIYMAGFSRPVDSNCYKARKAYAVDKVTRIITLFEKGYITEDEAVQEMIEL